MEFLDEKLWKEIGPKFVERKEGRKDKELIKKHQSLKTL